MMSCQVMWQADRGGHKKELEAKKEE